MPIYEFHCENCQNNFEDLVAINKIDTCPDTECPKCHSKKWEKLISCPSFNFSNPEGTDRWNNSSTGHDYRFKHNIPKVKKERKNAEQNSHMGSDPYGKEQIKKDIERDIGIHTPETRSGLS